MLIACILRKRAKGHHAAMDLFIQQVVFGELDKELGL